MDESRLVRCPHCAKRFFPAGTPEEVRPVKYFWKPGLVEAITFAELVDYGRTHGANIVNGMPWAFSYEGHPITHENDTCYLIPMAHGVMEQFTPGDMLVTEPGGVLRVYSPGEFAREFEQVGSRELSRLAGPQEPAEEKAGLHQYGEAYGDLISPTREPLPDENKGGIP